MSSEFAFKNILIIGLGVMGGSFLKNLQTINTKIYAMEIDLETQTKVKKENKNIEFITFNDKDILNKVDLVISTLYPDKVIDFMKEINNQVNSECLVVEISGIKKEIAKHVQLLDLNYSYLLVHPMAGRENGGYDYSDDTIYLGANHIIINDVKQCSEELFNKYLSFIEAIGFKAPFLMNVEEHDQAITFTSQLTHIISVALLNSKDYQPHTSNTIGDSFRDLTRIAKLKVDLWTLLFTNNKENLTSSIDNFIEQLEYIKTLLDKPDQLAKELEKARIKRIEF